MKNKKCACCGQLTLLEDSEFEICPACGWQDDKVQNEDPKFTGGANDMSLELAKEAYRRGTRVEKIKTSFSSAYREVKHGKG